VQRIYRTAKLLDVPAPTAKHNALQYYYTLYMRRAEKDGDPDQYFSDQCVPDGALDEQLSDSSWASHL
jgi:hypothetical protein